jgi:hypothetical protein
MTQHKQDKERKGGDMQITIVVALVAGAIGAGLVLMLSKRSTRDILLVVATLVIATVDVITLIFRNQ